ncbi:membrane-associated tyrosine- and threonine-specific cdc2-inhibitory kinase-like [Anneissia japonica]|uniref:membrane-associated tyrosine- and threonine-specific cdc2-inhibitory kinase-like n=1 Tax=Anneissia japonica TaxID=1529436 RepID=UPI001425582C|nr:membrane-associated tyrosine- and threonine-specific cdc2-inhibitory kinase-like [Anneissia japonica]
MNIVMDLGAEKDLFKSPRPTPKFLSQRAVFSHKKDVGRTPRDAPPPRPPLKSVPPVSRLFPSKTKNECLRAHSVSFIDANNSKLQSPIYDASSNGLFFDQCFEIQRKLGEGSFGEVFQVKSKEDGKIYAVKRSRDRFRGEADKRRKLAEVQKLEALSRHPNCVEFHQAWAEKGHLYIQTEICQTSLEHFTDTNHDITEDKAWEILIDLLQGVKNLHEHNLLHMDIKPDNIFLSYDGVCKLGDFGLALDYNKGDLSDAQEGDPKYLAPELLQGKFGKEADIFSLGITMLELACDLDLPRNGELWHELRSGKIPDEITEGVSPDLKEIVEEMMNPDPQLRPNVYELLQRPAIQTAWRRRRRMLVITNWISKVQLFFSFLHSLLIFIWFLTLGRVIHKKTSITPEKQEVKQQYKKDWDLSFSDDECFNNSSSLGHFLNDSSFSSEEDQSKVYNFSTSNFLSLYSRTPIKARTPRAASVTPNPRNSSPKCNLFGPNGR